MWKSSVKKQLQSFYSFTARNSKGEDVSMANYKEKVVLIFNGASKCGLTDTNYKELAELDKKYRNQGLSILGFPCNQFLSQEPGTQAEICTFVSQKYSIEFEMFEKIDVNGAKAHPLFVYLKNALPGIITNGISWNFTKFLIDRNGNPYKRFGPNESPKSFENDIKKLLEQTASKLEK